jgi:hypothetical protein
MRGELRVTAGRDQARRAVFPALWKMADGILADRLELEKTFDHGGVRCSLREDMLRDLDQRGASAFFDGLIPEGWLLEIAEKTWKIDPRDRMGLLLACCRDCIGAAGVVPLEEGCT